MEPKQYKCFFFFNLLPFLPELLKSIVLMQWKLQNNENILIYKINVFGILKGENYKSMVILWASNYNLEDWNRIGGNCNTFSNPLHLLCILLVFMFV